MTDYLPATHLPADTPLTGAEAGLWAAHILEGLSAPVTKVNVYALAGWFHREGGGGANNPMNTTLHDRGAVGTINSAGVESFDTPDDGIHATIDTLHTYPAVVVSLRGDRGLTGPGVPAELHLWSGGGYDSIIPVVVPMPVRFARGVFTAAVAMDEAKRWTVRPTHNESGVQLGGPDQWDMVYVSVNRSTGEWRIG